jgi:ribosomal protein S4
MRGAQQLIVHGKVLVNNKIVRSKSYMLNSGDLISIDPKHHLLIEENIVKSDLGLYPKAFSYKIKQCKFYLEIFEIRTLQ